MENKKKDNAIIIGIDHGYGFMKTASNIMKSGIKEVPVVPPFAHNILEYGNRVYVVGQCRQNHEVKKTDTPDYYILTLAAIAAELKIRNRKRGNVIIAAGLPYSFFSSQREEFKKYLMQNENVKYRYCDIDYEIHISNVFIFPQGFPVISEKLDSLQGKNTVVDVGSRTLDVLTFQENEAQHEYCFSMQGGTIDCIESIQKDFMSKYQVSLEENIIQDFLQGKEGQLKEEHCTFLEQLTRFYVRNSVLSALEAKGISFEFTHVTFCGGGAVVVKNYGDLHTSQFTFVEDIHANAKGFEYLCKGILRQNGK